MLLPLVLLWLAAHAVLLAAILGLKFLGAKMAVVLLLAAALFWLTLGNRQRASLLLASPVL